jgi:putative aminopeptidase FrvX
MKRKILLTWLGSAVIILTLAAPAYPEDVKSLLKEIFPISSVTGNEEILVAKIASLIPRTLTVGRDNLGSLYARSGQGSDSLVLLVALDEFGYFVSGIAADGYLRVDRTLPAPLPIQDSFLMGHAVSIATKQEPIEGVVCQPSLHIATPEMREKLSNGPSLDMIYIDIGVRSESEARARGIEILDPVTFSPDLITLAGDRLGGTALGMKAACAAATSALLTTAGGSRHSGVACVWMAQTRMMARKYSSPLGAVRAKLKLKPKTVLLIGTVDADRDENSPMIGKGPAILQAGETPSELAEAVRAAARTIGAPLQRGISSDPLLTAFSSEGTDVVLLAIPVKFAGTPSEVLDMKDVKAVADIAAGTAAAWRTR